MNLTKKECAININSAINFSEILSYFDDFIALNFVLQTKEFFYFENNILLASEVGQDVLTKLDLKLWRLFSCIKKPEKDCVEMKSDGDYGKVRFQIWLEDMFYKYNKSVPKVITNNLKDWERVLTYNPPK